MNRFGEIFASIRAVVMGGGGGGEGHSDGLLGVV